MQGLQEQLQARLSGWGARAILAVLLLVFSELVVWQSAADYTVLDWLGVALVYLALAAICLDLIARYNVNDVMSLLLVAGMYGLVNATLISRIVGRDLPLSLIVRPLGAQPLAFVGALAAYHLLANGRATTGLDAGIAAVSGLAWGIWTRWFPVVSDESLPEVELGVMLVVVGILLLAAVGLRFVLRPAGIYKYDEWLLTPYEWTAAGAVLVTALVIADAQGAVEMTAVGLVVTLVGFLALMLHMTLATRREPSYLESITPLRKPNLAALAMVFIPFLVGGLVGYSLPGGDDESVQSSMLIGALTIFGIVWVPVASVIIGIRAFIQLAREEG
ncbi:MAG: hypothetical protein GYB65_16415 [Chloroflexi bacterium]|nr:hypothetical protein [Chloroflexota bacterium]